MKSVHYVITGSTGFLGREVLARLLGRGDSATAIVRRRNGESMGEAHARVAGLVHGVRSDISVAALQVEFGDVTQPALGLDESTVERLWSAGSPIHLVHGAAQVRFDLPWSEMFRQNVLGTERVLALATRLHVRGALRRFDYVSTCFVGGDAPRLAESDLDIGQRPRNLYERSKMMSEASIARARRMGLPVTVHRPSIIVGDSRTGRASSFKVLYWPLKLYARGRWRTIFGRPDCSVDVVPVDYVADAMVALFGESCVDGKTLHLAAGAGSHAKISELAALAADYFSGRPVRYFDPELYRRWLRPVLLPWLRVFRPDVARRGAVFLPYLVQNPIFETTETEAILRPYGLSAPPVQTYFRRIMEYAARTDFGRRVPSGAGA